MVLFTSIFSCTSSDEATPTPTVTTSAPTQTPVDTTTMTTDTTAVVTDSVVEESIVYHNVNIEGEGLNIVFYELPKTDSSEFNIPQDSILNLAGITFEQKNDGSISLTSDPSVISDDMTFIMSKGKLKSVSQYGITKEVSCKKFSYDNDSLFLDGKYFAIENPIKEIRVGVRAGNPVLVKGNNINISTDKVKIGDITINVTGESNIKVDAETVSSLNASNKSIVTVATKSITTMQVTGNAKVTANCTWIGSIATNDSSSTTLTSCDSIAFVNARNKSRLQYPKNTNVVKEKSSSDDNIVMK